VKILQNAVKGVLFTPKKVVFSSKCSSKCSESSARLYTVRVFRALLNVGGSPVSECKYNFLGVNKTPFTAFFEELHAALLRVRFWARLSVCGFPVSECQYNFLECKQDSFYCIFEE